MERLMKRNTLGRTSSVSTFYNYSLFLYFRIQAACVVRIHRSIIWNNTVVIDALIKSFSLENKIVVKKKKKMKEEKEKKKNSTPNFYVLIYELIILNEGKSSPHIFCASFFSPFHNVVGIHFHFLIVLYSLIERTSEFHANMNWEVLFI